MKQSTFNKIARLVNNADCLNSNLEDFFASYDIEEIETADDILYRLEEDGAFDIEIIYYDRAMKYLMEHDPSLTDSLQYAEEMGYTAGSLNSEILASLLASSRARDEFYELQNEIQDIIDENE